MNKKLIAFIFVAASALFSQAHAQIESGGLIGASKIYDCAERQPQDPANPIQVILYQQLDESFVLTVGNHLKDPGSIKISYSNTVFPNLGIFCLIECHIYDNADDQVSFGVTILPENEIQGYYSKGSDYLDLACTQRKENN